MKGEIRGLKVGEYLSKDGTLLLRLKKTDNGVMIEIADFDADIFYEANIDGKEVEFEWGNVTPTSIEDSKGIKNGED
jgi:hypothetical protein